LVEIRLQTDEFETDTTFFPKYRKWWHTLALELILGVIDNEKKYLDMESLCYKHDWR
jgi:hypothetical protein